MKHDGYLLMKMLYYKLWTSNVSLWSVVREAGSRVDIQRVGVGIRNWGRHELLHGYYHVFQNWCGVSSVSGLLDDSMETGVFVSSVTHSANGAIRFYQLVVTFDFIAVTFLSLFFDIVSVWILHSVLEFVMRRSLKLLKVILTYLLTSWSRVLLLKLTGTQLVKKFPEFYGTRRFTTAFTSAFHLSLSWARSIYSMPPSYSLNIDLNTILPPTPSSSKWSLSLRFPHQNPVYTTHVPRTCHMPRPSYYSWFHHPNNIWWGVQIIKLLIM